jgi:hypothetical protein
MSAAVVAPVPDDITEFVNVVDFIDIVPLDSFSECGPASIPDDALWINPRYEEGQSIMLNVIGHVARWLIATREIVKVTSLPERCWHIAIFIVLRGLAGKID